MPALATSAVTFPGPANFPTDLGFNGFERMHIAGDGAATTLAIALPTSLSIKTVLGCIGCSSDIPATGRAVDGTTVTTFTFFGAATGGVLPTGQFEILLYGRGR